MHATQLKPVWQRRKRAEKTCDVCSQTMYRWIRDGNVAVMKVGRVVYVDVARWVLEDEDED